MYELLDHDLFHALAAFFGLPELLEEIREYASLKRTPGVGGESTVESLFLCEAGAPGQADAVFVQVGSDPVADPCAVLDGGAVAKKDLAHLTTFFGGLPNEFGQATEVDACQFDGAVAVVVAEVVPDFGGLGTFKHQAGVAQCMEAVGDLETVARGFKNQGVPSSEVLSGPLLQIGGR